MAISKLQANQSKNRSTHFAAFDHCRVTVRAVEAWFVCIWAHTLAQLDGGGAFGYINANYVQVLHPLVAVLLITYL